MKADDRFRHQDKSFWACVRSLSQDLGYTDKKTKNVKVPSIQDMKDGFIDLRLNWKAICDERGNPTDLALKLSDYFAYRADALNVHAPRSLMDFEDATALYNKLITDFQVVARIKNKKHLSDECTLKGTNIVISIPRNKQKDEKSGPALLTGIVNMAIAKAAEGADCDYDPRKLTTITRDLVPLRTLARRVDGAFPNSINPMAIWEIKEYYHTTTFGSRIADGVYETLLDGLELEELQQNEGVSIKHYLIIDSRRTWWGMGKAYLCRIVDMLNMGYVDEVLFGKEVIDEIPRLVSEWIQASKTQQERGSADPVHEM